MNNKLLRQLIIDELDFDPKVDAAQIGVAVENGIVTLTGHVGSYAEKIAAEDTVRGVEGVKAIAQEIEVRLPGQKMTSDDEIAKRAVAMLAWDVGVPDDRVQVQVQNGWITLSGDVDWYHQKEAAGLRVRNLSGVVGIKNLITIRPTQPSAQPAEVRKKIEEALKRNAEVDANSIRVSVADGKVTLEGKVKSWYERQLAENAAWAAHGVRAVEDHIEMC